ARDGTERAGPGRRLEAERLARLTVADGRRPGVGNPVGDVRRQRTQLRVGPRREYLADPHVELTLGQPTLDERGLEHVDHLLALGTRGPQPAQFDRRPVFAPC